MKKQYWRLVLRVVLTVAIWILLVVYIHKLGHQYLGDIKTALNTPVSRIIFQILFIVSLVYLVILSLPGIPTPRLRGIFSIGIWATLLAVGHQLSHAGFHEVQTILSPESLGLSIFSITFAAFLYMIVLALPFVPAIELGILIMALFGQLGIIVAYLATIGGLFLAFAAARFLPASIRDKWMVKLGIDPDISDADAVMESLMISEPDNTRLGHRMKSGLLRHRHLMLAASLNLPGNSVIGGGGGIAFVCGASGIFRWGGFIATTLLATAPIPIVVWLGLVEIEPLLEKHGLLHELLSYLESFLTH
jgi:hypothetical protein